MGEVGEGHSREGGLRRLGLGRSPCAPRASEEPQYNFVGLRVRCRGQSRGLEVELNSDFYFISLAPLWYVVGNI